MDIQRWNENKTKDMVTPTWNNYKRQRRNDPLEILTFWDLF